MTLGTPYGTWHVVNTPLIHSRGFAVCRLTDWKMSIKRIMTVTHKPREVRNCGLKKTDQLCIFICISSAYLIVGLHFLLETVSLICRRCTSS